MKLGRRAALRRHNLPAVPGRSIRYSCGAQDELINQIGLSVLSEMTSPTAAGRMLVETSSLLLAARLAHSHLETELIRSPIQSLHRLDEGRLRRVLAYIEEHLAEDITGGKESPYPRCADLPSMQNGSNGRNREYRPRRSRTRFAWVRVPQVRVCDECRSASAEKANAREALMPYS
jgi:hypothetical protein